MKFKATTIVLVLVSLSLTGVIYVTEIRDDGFSLQQDDPQQADPEKIFAFSSEDVQQIQIDLNDQLIIFHKTESEQNPWHMIQPESFIASDAAVSFLLNLFPQAQNKLSIPISPAKSTEYAITSSSPQIELTLANGDRYQMLLGKANFDDTQIYAQVNFPPSAEQKSSIYLVSKSFQYAIERNFEEWKAEE